MVLHAADANELPRLATPTDWRECASSTFCKRSPFVSFALSQECKAPRLYSIGRRPRTIKRRRGANRSLLKGRGLVPKATQDPIPVITADNAPSLQGDKTSREARLDAVQDPTP